MKVLVISYHALVGQSLATMVRTLLDHGSVEAKVCAPSAAVDCVRGWQPDILLLDAIADFAAGVSTVRAITSALADVHILVLGIASDETSVYAAIIAGADGYLPEDVSPETLAATMHGMARGELGLSRVGALGVVRRLRAVARRRRAALTADAIHGKLTQREREVFELVRCGKRSREIAEELCIAEGTVYKHIQNILDKLHAHNRTHAIFVTEADALTN